MADAYVMFLRNDGFTLRHIKAGNRHLDYFIRYRHFPFFENKPFRHITNVRLRFDDHFYWPDLDINLTVTQILNPVKEPSK